jgi:mono/diheme cytochrome c family protein
MMGVLANIWPLSSWHNDLRHWIIVLNIVAVVGLIVYVIVSVLGPKRTGHEEKLPANLTPFLDDEDLEGRRLERVQGWALIFAAIVAIALPVYWLHEPARQKKSASYFDNNSVHRGEVLFANQAMTAFDSTTSVKCADCHGTKGEGGTTKYTVNGVKQTWKVPPLNTEYLRFTEDPNCLDQAKRALTNPICEMTDIITYGRPGTPMPAWGVEGGGPLNDQAIADLVAYIESITLTPAQAQQEAQQAFETAKQEPTAQVAAARSTLAADTAALNTQLKATGKALGTPDASQAAVTAQCNAISAQVDKDPSKVNRAQALSCGQYLVALAKVQADQATLDWAIEWEKRRVNVSDGQILFEQNCARCHTEGWSIFDPTAAPGTPGSVDVLGLSGGGGGSGGGIGFNLRGGDEIRRFGSDEDNGWQMQVDFVTKGSDPFVAYGNAGIGSGRMPGFGKMLTPQQIGEIVSYERYCLDITTYTGVTPTCATPNKSRVPPTTTTVPTTTTTKG